MSDVRVTEQHIEKMMQNAKVQVYTVFDKCTIVAMQFENGFILTAASACVDPANYDEKLGVQYAKQDIENQLWKLEGYALQSRISNREEDK